MGGEGRGRGDVGGGIDAFDVVDGFADDRLQRAEHCERHRVAWRGGVWPSVEDRGQKRRGEEEEKGRGRACRWAYTGSVGR